MKSKTKQLFCLFLFVSSFGMGQNGHYQFKRQLPKVTENWYKIVLPAGFFSNVKNDMSDIRIVGITPKGDTIQAPYFIHFNEDKVVAKDVEFKLLNESEKEGAYYFTFQVPESDPINEIKLDIKQTNFDWKVNLEASHDQKEWFSVVENYRILSIQNGYTNYQFNKIIFVPSNYTYYRVQFKSDEKPLLEKATLTLYERSDGNYRNYQIKSMQTRDSEPPETTFIDLDLGMKAPVSSFMFDIEDRFDYYRHFTIQYLSDSFKTEKGWKSIYAPLTSGVVSSIEKRSFIFETTIVSKIRVLIENNDNMPLNIRGCLVRGYNFELITRFTEEADYFVVYGNLRASKPDYDITYFKNHIPEELVQVNLGPEELIPQPQVSVNQPLFKNKLWLWAILLFIIVVLGYFSIGMMRKV